MPSHQSPSVSVARRGAGCHVGDPLRTVVWVRGDHDIATQRHLTATLARAGRLDDADLVVDLSGVTFMDASTIGALVTARLRLRGAARSLSVRAPSHRAHRLLDVCGLLQWLDGPAESRASLDSTAPGVPTHDHAAAPADRPYVRDEQSSELAHVLAPRHLRPALSRPPPEQP